MELPMGLMTQTAAARALFLLKGARRVVAGVRRRKRAKKASGPRKTKRAMKRGKGKLMRLVKGSAAAKAYMAKIRKRRR
jgi:hypothetical protein